jgi:hypothetical protein
VTAGGAPGTRAPRRNTAIAAVLGPELHSEVKRTEREAAKGEIDIDVLLRGAEKLNAVYEVRGTVERIQGLRRRYAQVRDSVTFYENKVERQTRDLERMNRGGGRYGDEEEEEEDYEDELGLVGEEPEMDVTDEDLRTEEEEIRELERKKRELEDRVSGMERDLGGLLR